MDHNISWFNKYNTLLKINKTPLYTKILINTMNTSYYYYYYCYYLINKNIY